jgi:hypothetical protein
LNRRKQDRYKYADDRDDDEQLDQREPAATARRRVNGPALTEI